VTCQSTPALRTLCTVNSQGPAFSLALSHAQTPRWRREPGQLHRGGPWAREAGAQLPPPPRLTLMSNCSSSSLHGFCRRLTWRCMAPPCREGPAAPLPDPELAPRAGRGGGLLPRGRALGPPAGTSMTMRRSDSCAPQTAGKGG
jgi:hypothetical protein